MQFLVISCGLNPQSRSASMAKLTFDTLNKSHNTQWIDLRDHPLPICTGQPSDNTQDVLSIEASITQAHGIILATPIHNYSASSSAKNLLDLTSNNHAWKNKVVGLLCAASGTRSYMSLMSLANSLMLWNSCTIVPDFVYAADSDFSENNSINPHLKPRIQLLANDLIRFTQALIPANK